MRVCTCSKLFMFAFVRCRQYANFKGHVRVLHEIAANAAHGDKKRRHVLCQFYDELVRKEWSEIAARGDTGFSVDDACQIIDRLDIVPLMLHDCSCMHWPSGMFWITPAESTTMFSDPGPRLMLMRWLLLQRPSMVVRLRVSQSPSMRRHLERASSRIRMIGNLVGNKIKSRGNGIEARLLFLLSCVTRAPCVSACFGRWAPIGT